MRDFWWYSGTLLPVGCYCISQRPTWLTDSSVGSKPSSLSRCFKWRLLPKPGLEHVPQGTACIIQGRILLKQTFKSKPGFWKLNHEAVYIYIDICTHAHTHIYLYTHTHKHIFTVLEIDIILSCVSRAGVTVLLHGLVVKCVYHKWCFWGKICISGGKWLLTACSCVHAHFSYKVKICINWCVLCELDWICTVTK